MNLTPGSKSSLKFLKSLKEAENYEIFRTSVARYIDYKWEQTRWMVYILASMYLTQSIVITYHAIGTDRKDSTMHIIMLIINVFLFLIELQ